MDSITLTSVGAVAISEGIKFLYGQATDLLRRLRERSDKDKEAAADIEPVRITLPAEAFDGNLQNPEIHYQQLEKLQTPLNDLRRSLADYAEGLATVDPADANLIAAVDGIRQMLEAVFGQRITFKGEQRARSGPVVEGEIRVDRILGEATAVRARLVKSGFVRGSIEAAEVGSGASVTGVDVDLVGD